MKYSNIFKITSVIIFSLWHSSMIFCAQSAKYTLLQIVGRGDKVELVVTLRNNKSGYSVAFAQDQPNGELQIKNGRTSFGDTPKHKQNKMLRILLAASIKYPCNFSDPNKEVREDSFCRQDLPDSMPINSVTKVKKMLGRY